MTAPRFDAYREKYNEDCRAGEEAERLREEARDAVTSPPRFCEVCHKPEKPGGCCGPEGTFEEAHS